MSASADGAPVLEPRPVRIGHIGLVVSDIDRAVRFYTEVVGLRLTERFTYPEEVGHGATVAAGAFVRCDSAHHCISIFTLRSDPRTRAAQGEALGLHHLAFEMATPEELLAKLRQVREHGVAIVSARRGGPGNQPRFYIRDPDGNLVEFYWGIDQVGWEGRARKYRPIEEIDLPAFDFAGFVREREEAAASQAAASAAAATVAGASEPAASEPASSQPAASQPAASQAAASQPAASQAAGGDGTSPPMAAGE
jgi:catechol 2,3-dioxygenase-like lactoylglutathione lyase family enzyme